MGNDFEMCGQTVAILGGYLCAINRSQEIQNFVHICKHIYKDVHAKHIYDCNCNNKIKTITVLVNNENEMLKHYTRFFYSSGSLRILCLSCKLK